MTVAELQHEIIRDELAKAAPDRSLEAWKLTADHLTWALEVRIVQSDEHPALGRLPEQLRNELADLRDWLLELGAREVAPLGECPGAAAAWVQRAAGAPTETQAALDWLLDDDGPLAVAMRMRNPFARPAHDGAESPIRAPGRPRKRAPSSLQMTLEWLEEHPGAYLDTTPPELMPGIRALMLAGLLVRDGGWSAPPDWRARLEALRDEKPEATRG